MTLAGTKVDILGAARQQGLQALVRRRLDTVLGRVPARPYTARVTFLDENGPKGGLAWRCAITVHLPDRPARRVDCTADTRWSAFDGAVERVDRQLLRLRERIRDDRRHPKKYFAAARLFDETPVLARRRAAR